MCCAKCSTKVYQWEIVFLWFLWLNSDTAVYLLSGRTTVLKLNAVRTPTQGTRRRSLHHPTPPPPFRAMFEERYIHKKLLFFIVCDLLTDFTDACPVSMKGKEIYFGQKLITEAILLDNGSSRSCVVFWQENFIILEEEQRFAGRLCGRRKLLLCPIRLISPFAKYWSKN